MIIMFVVSAMLFYTTNMSQKLQLT